MATNLRLHPDAEQALRHEAARTGRTQQELIREAVDRYLGRTSEAPVRTDRDALVLSRVVLPVRVDYHELAQLVSMPDDRTTGELLDRDERV